MQHLLIDPAGAMSGAGLAFIVPDDREAIEAAVEALIARLDEADGDTDLEPDGDELDGNGSEEDFMHHGANYLGEPGCPISDPGEHLWRYHPAYGVDQSKGPLNEQAAIREHYRRQQLGLA